MKKINKVTIISFTLFILSLLFFLYRNIIGFGYLTFGDESGHFLGAIAIHHGDILYRDYIDAHGPLIFIATWLLGLFTGFSKVWLFRLVSTFFISIAGITIFKSSIFENLWQRFLATALWFASIACVWVVQGLYLDSYWTVGGALAVIILATTILPMLHECNITKINSFVGGVAIGLLPFTAYPFSLLSTAFILVILCLSIYKYQLYRISLLMAFLGCLIAVFTIIFWLLIYGDVGGMIAFHFIANQFYYKNYTSMNLMDFIQVLIPSIKPDHFIENLAIYTFFSGSTLLCISTKNKINAIIVVLGLATLELRAALGFQNGTFLIASFGLFILSLIIIMKNRPKLSIIIGLFFLIIVALHSKYATSSPFGQTTDQRKSVSWQLFKERPDVGFVQEIQKYTKIDQRILVIPYNPDVYIYANRLPIKKYHAYLPWEADYALHPWYGYDRDICIDLPKEKPAVIYFDNYIVWGAFSAEKYMPCVLDFMNKEYTSLPNNSFVYIRNDLLKNK